MRCGGTVEYWPAFSISNIIVRFSEWGSLLLSFFSWSPKFGRFSERSDGLALSGIAWKRASLVGKLVWDTEGEQQLVVVEFMNLQFSP